MPTTTTRKKTASTRTRSKPDHRRAYGLKILNSNHRDIRRLKREGHWPELHGNKFWNSSFLIMSYLRKHPLPRGARVLEIGCGWGLLGIFCAKNFGAHVTGVDADPNVFPYLELHARANGVEVATERKTFQRITTERLRSVDVILGADICFWDDLSPVLFNLIKRAEKAGVQQTIIADPSRSPFTDLATRCQDHFDDVDVVERYISRPVQATGELLIVGG